MEACYIDMLLYFSCRDFLESNHENIETVLVTDHSVLGRNEGFRPNVRISLVTLV